MTGEGNTFTHTGASTCPDADLLFRIPVPAGTIIMAVRWPIPKDQSSAINTPTRPR